MTPRKTITHPGHKEKKAPGCSITGPLFRGERGSSLGANRGPGSLQGKGPPPTQPTFWRKTSRSRRSEKKKRDYGQNRLIERRKKKTERRIAPRTWPGLQPSQKRPSLCRFSPQKKKQKRLNRKTGEHATAHKITEVKNTPKGKSRLHGQEKKETRPPWVHPARKGGGTSAPLLGQRGEKGKRSTPYSPGGRTLVTKIGFAFYGRKKKKTHYHSAT